MLALIRCDATDDQPDIWVADRLELGWKSVSLSIANGETEKAILQIENNVSLLEKTMMITDEVPLPTSCRFLDGMKWYAKEQYESRYNDPDSPKERMVSMDSEIQNTSFGYLIYPSDSLKYLEGKMLGPLQDHPEFEKLCDRVKALIVTKPNE